MFRQLISWGGFWIGDEAVVVGEGRVVYSLYVGEKEVELKDQYELAQARITKLSRFAAIEDDRNKFKALMVSTCAVGPETVDGRIVTSDLVTC